MSDDEKRMLADWHNMPGADVARRYSVEKRREEEIAMGRAALSDPSNFDPIEAARMDARHNARMELLNLGFFAQKAREHAAKANQES